MTDRTVTFKLNGKRPDDFTIERLAQYLAALGSLVGSPGKVRVKKITPGSVKVELTVDYYHYPKFVERLTGAKNSSKAPAALRKAVADIEEMITADSVTAEVLAGRTKLLKLHGYTSDCGDALGPIIQPLTIRGAVIGLEGKDDTKHVRISEFGSGREFRGEIRDGNLANLLKESLWGDVIEISGTARFFRHPNGAWELRSYKIDRFTTLDASSLAEVLADLRKTLGPKGAEVLGDLRKLRG